LGKKFHLADFGNTINSWAACQAGSTRFAFHIQPEILTPPILFCQPSLLFSLPFYLTITRLANLG
jgi:hypothetical protein